MLERGRTHGVEHRRVEADSFFALIPEAFGYPLRGTSKYILLLGSVFLSVVGYMATVPLYGFVAAVFVLGYMASFLFEVVSCSASGQPDMPALPALTSFFEDILVPAFLMIATLAVCLLPAAGVWVWGQVADRSTALVAWPLLILGLVCFPMALLGVAMTRMVQALNPLAIVAAIVRVPLEYAVVCAIFVAVRVLQHFASPGLLAGIPVLGYMLRGLLSLYLAVVQMRLLGLLYYTKAETLGWFAVE